MTNHPTPRSSDASKRGNWFNPRPTCEYYLIHTGCCSLIEKAPCPRNGISEDCAFYEIRQRKFNPKEREI
ncbi:MAG TPA: hypothetical protein VMX17_15350 [Candidatus Glassbacteria bacterium]|nr:hypothetical protein [Candidatus Glassbacteria bacterium]